METCKKVKYASERDANNDIERIRIKSKRNTIPIRSYKCPVCSSWHLTSREDWKDKIAKLENQIKDLTTENTRLQSEILTLRRGSDKEIRLEVKKDERLVSFQKKIEKQNKLIGMLRKDNSYLINKMMTNPKA